MPTEKLVATVIQRPALARVHVHVRRFAEIMSNRRGHELKQWIAAVEADTISSLTGFATALLPDYDAVVAGLTLRYSSGVVEGHNNRINMLKRQMFGRAGFDLLRKRVLHSA